MAPSRGGRKRRLRAVLVEPFLGGSHAAFARGWMAHSRHDWRLISLPAARWKWRLRFAGLVLGPRLAALSPEPDVVVATSLMDLAHLRLAAGPAGAKPILLYMHENQLDYPRPPSEPLERGFAVAHLASLAAADRVAFNSRSHRAACTKAMGRFMAEAPPPHPRRWATALRRARVIAPGVDLEGFPAPGARPAGEPPVIVWNHRWEDDKRPGAFARVLIKLADSGRHFRLVLLGPVEQVRPQPLELIKQRLGSRILHAGPAARRRDYVGWLARGDIAVSTAAQENFGYAIVEAMAAGAVPLLPHRLSYPELLPRGLWDDLLYATDRGLSDRLARWLGEPGLFARRRAAVMRAARRWEWPDRARELDDWVEDAVRGGARHC